MLSRAIRLLKQLIATPSVSRDEADAAAVVFDFLNENGAEPQCIFNNVWAINGPWREGRPTLLLNSHIDTVKPVSGWTRDPFAPTEEDGKIYGLGANDAGASAVSLATTFLLLKEQNIDANLILALTAEEEITGPKGLITVLQHLEAQGVKIDMAVVGEPTQMQPAVAERGLVVLDGVAVGQTGHAARNEGDNALYHAIDDINALRAYRFSNVSPTLGPIKVTTTMIHCGTQHNVVPDKCEYVVDVRTTDAYSNEETVALLQSALISPNAQLKPRSTRIRASVIDESHPLVRAARGMGLKPFVSPTTSDMCLMQAFPSLKIGPGDSARSHTADEYVKVDEIAAAIELYPELIKRALELC